MSKKLLTGIDSFNKKGEHLMNIQYYESGDYYDVAWDPDLVRNDFTQHRNNDVGTDQYGCCRESHSERVDQ